MLRMLDLIARGGHVRVEGSLNSGSLACAPRFGFSVCDLLSNYAPPSTNNDQPLTRRKKSRRASNEKNKSRENRATTQV